MNDASHVRRENVKSGTIGTHVHLLPRGADKALCGLTAIDLPPAVQFSVEDGPVTCRACLAAQKEAERPHTTLRFDGVVEWPFKIEGGTIGGLDVIDALEGVRWKGPVAAALMDERFDGHLHACCGSPGYSEWTPAEPCNLLVGGHDLAEILRQHDGQVVSLIVTDEPTNVLGGTDG